MKFELELLDDQKNTQVAILDTSNTTFTWLKNNENVFPSTKELHKFFPEIKSISPSNPGEKSQSPSLIKIQLGLACNYSCHYCSQSIAKSENSIKFSEQIEKAELFLKKFDHWFIENEIGTTIEFWGGETLLYWPAIKIIADHLRFKYK